MFLCRMVTQISGRKFLPELCGEVHPEKLPLSKLSAVSPCSTEQSTFRRGEKGAKAFAWKRGGGGVTSGGRVRRGPKFGRMELAEFFR